MAAAAVAAVFTQRSSAPMRRIEWKECEEEKRGSVRERASERSKTELQKPNKTRTRQLRRPLWDLVPRAMTTLSRIPDQASRGPPPAAPGATVGSRGDEAEVGWCIPSLSSASSGELCDSAATGGEEDEDEDDGAAESGAGPGAALGAAPPA